MPDGYGADDQEAIAQWLFARLQANDDVTELLGEDEAIRCFPDLPPQDETGNPLTDYPYLTFSFITAHTLRAAGHRQRILSRQRLVLHVVAAGEDYTAAAALSQLIDGSLTADDAKGEVALNGTTHYVNVAGPGEPFRQADSVSGRQFRTVGRIYEVAVSDR